MVIPPSFPRNQKILYCVLNWGLGHATRSIEVINNLIEYGNQVDIASDGAPIQLLKQYFPTGTYYELPSYNVTYPTSSTFINFLANSPNIFRAYLSETKYINKLQKINNYDVIISDSRPGCNANRLNNIYITHQLNPIHHNLLLKYLFRKINTHYINQFSEVWIPDYPNHSLSGELSHNIDIKVPVHFINPISPYTATTKSQNSITILLSGPEPKRTVLEEQLYKLISNQVDKRFIFIRGTHKENQKLKPLPHITFYNLCSLHQMNEILNNTHFLISRTGYSTLMDMERLLIKQAILIPTKGQTEQEYLGVLHKKRYDIVSEDELVDYFSTLCIF